MKQDRLFRLPEGRLCWGNIEREQRAESGERRATKDKRQKSQVEERSDEIPQGGDKREERGNW